MTDHMPHLHTMQGVAGHPQGATRPRMRRILAGSAVLALSGAVVGSGGTLAAMALASGRESPMLASPASAAITARLASVTLPAGAAAGTTSAVDPSADPVVSASAEVSPAVVTIITSSQVTDTSLGQDQGATQPDTSSQGQSQFGIPDGQTPVGLGSGFIFDANGCGPSTTKE